MRKTRRYTEDDIRFIRKWWKRKTVAQIARHVRRSESAVRTKAWELGLTNGHEGLWTEEEVAVLRSNYGFKKASEIARMLDRSTHAVSQKIFALGLCRSTGVRLYENESGTKVQLAYNCRIFWTPQMITMLREYYPNTANAECAALFGVSVAPLHRKVRELGIRKDPEWLRDCSRRGLSIAWLHNTVRGNSGQWQHRPKEDRGIGFMAKYKDRPEAGSGIKDNINLQTN